MAITNASLQGLAADPTMGRSKVNDSLLDMIQKGRSPVAQMGSLAQSRNKYDAKADGYARLAEAMGTPNSIGGGFVKGFADARASKNEVKAQEQRDAVNARMAQLLEYEQKQAEHRQEIEDFLITQQYMQAQQPVFASAVELAEKTNDTQELYRATQGNESFVRVMQRNLPQGATYDGISIIQGPDGVKRLAPSGKLPDGSRVDGASMMSMDEAISTFAPNVAAERAQAKIQQELAMKGINNELALQEARIGSENAQADSYRALAEDRRRVEPVSQPSGEQYSTKPLPQGAMKLQDEAMTALGTVRGVNADIEALTSQIDSGKLSTSLMARGEAAVRNTFNASDEQSRNLSTLNSKLQSMRNAILILNKGVQTEGDAQRAMQEIIDNPNDTQLVRQRLQDLKVINERAAMLQQARIDSIRNEYGRQPMDYSSINNQPAAVGVLTPPRTDGSAGGVAPTPPSQTLPPPDFYKSKYGLE